MTKLIQLFFIVLFFATSSSSLASGANAGYSFKHYNTDNGLSQNTVRTIMQDNMGFMWFGTKDGLNRFDGTTFKLFKFSPDGELSDNVFHRIIQDKNNNIWVSTENGVYIYDVVKEVFHVFDKKTADNLTVNGVVTDMVIIPILSASSIIDSAIRSFILPAGFCFSSLIHTSWYGNNLFSRTCGVFPTVSKMLLYFIFETILFND
jgi:streptogramin lyase